METTRRKEGGQTPAAVVREHYARRSVPHRPVREGPIHGPVAFQAPSVLPLTKLCAVLTSTLRTTVIARSRGEPESFAALFDRHVDAAHRYVARRLGSEVANDLVAETFTTAFQQRHRFDPARGTGADARPWLCGIATNLVGRHRRPEARRFKATARILAPADHDEPLADRAADRVAAGAVRRELAAALAALPTRHRDVLLLVAWGDLSYEESARALGIPVGTVRSRLHRARSKLRETLSIVHLEVAGQGGGVRAVWCARAGRGRMASA